MAQNADISWVERGRAHQIIDGLRVTPGGLQQAARVKREFERSRVEVAGYPAMDRGSIKPPGCGEGTTGVAVSFRPLGPQCQDALVGRCCLFVSPAIAEHPGAQIRDFVAIGLQIKHRAGALDRLGKALPVVQSLAQAAIEPRSFVVGEIATLETKTVFLDLARTGHGYRHLTNFTSVAQPGGTLDAVRGPRFTCGRPACAAGAGSVGLELARPITRSMLG